MDKTLNQSAFLFGPGRSGTTIFFRILASHPDLGWISNYNELVPGRPEIAALSRLRVVSSWSRKRGATSRFLPTPKEALSVPRKQTAGHFQIPGVIDRNNIDHAAVDRYRKYLVSMLAWQGKDRLVHKHTGFARMHFLSRVDPTARYVRIIRDGRAVVNSLMNVDWWDGTLDSWWWNDMNEEYVTEYERSGRSKEALAAISWKAMLDLQEAEINAYPELPIVTVRYADFVEDAAGSMKKLCEFLGLEFSEAFRRNIAKFSMTDNDVKWKNQLTREQREYLNQSLSRHLAKYEFA
jgi:hypothetical protein